MSVYSYEPPFFSYDDFYRLLDNAWTSSNASGQESQRQGDAQHQTLARDFQPRMDIHESPKSNLVTAYIELPGLAKSNVNIEVQNNRIIVSGERNFSKETTAKGLVHRERQYGKFSRTLPLPVGVKVRILYSFSHL